jgi:23S rRNA (pseudouridine1915-N3)-methyltransferase
LKLAVIAVGALKEGYYREACAEYLKRMKVMRPVEVIEIAEEPLKPEAAPALIEQALEREGRRIVSRLRPDDMVTALSPAGKTMDSQAFAQAINPADGGPGGRLVFVIGSSHGLGEQVYARSSWQLSFGPMTFPHQLARLLLLEQLYRGQMIANNRAYHK